MLEQVKETIISEFTYDELQEMEDHIKWMESREWKMIKQKSLRCSFSKEFIE
ncbi:hypothetical protein [Aquibacillus saliphilus]|uniref:hypothetical protein n=1 Tax=Aquibacillus saliphilus TaxID=1909422 RepID=UPI001CF07E4A|nr:hypothetical protein [Aquibacillus saliphilus]